MKASNVRGLDRSIWLVGSSSLDQTRRLEETRVEIEEMKARQKEYDEIIIK